MTFERSTTVASLATLGLGALVTGAAFVQTGGFLALFSGYGLLALSPYAVFCGACFLALSSGGRAIANFVVCALATAFAICVYVDLIFLNPGSMNGLVFYFVPIIQLSVAILRLVVVFLPVRAAAAGPRLTRHWRKPTRRSDAMSRLRFYFPPIAIVFVARSSSWSR
jgi:hypothetical protein